jgi:CDP-glycerol glycerophosphotransferase
VIRRSPLSLAGAGIRKAWLKVPGARALASAMTRLRRSAMPRWAAAAACRLSVTDIAVLSCDHGRRYDGHPRAIGDYLRSAEPGVRQFWIDADSLLDLPEGVGRLNTSTIRGAWTLARARYWIDDFGIDPGIRMNPRTTYLQTWHGVALKRVGSDAPDWSLTPARKRRPTRANLDRWDALLSPSEFFAGTTARAIGFGGSLIADCTPFGDTVLARSRESAVRARLDLPSHRAVVIYAPTCAGMRTGESALDLEAWWRAFGDRAYLLVRSHPSDPLQVPARWNNAIRDISNDDDYASFLGAADALITDYNSVLFDFARLRRPIAFLAPDYDEYTRRTVGLYLDLERSAPGPVLRDNPSLHAWFDGILDGRDSMPDQRRDDFVSMFAGEADGTGAARAVMAMRELA